MQLLHTANTLTFSCSPMEGGSSTFCGVLPTPSHGTYPHAANTHTANTHAHSCSPMEGGSSTFCSISSAQGTVVSLLTRVPVGKMPKNWGGRFSGKDHWYGAIHTWHEGRRGGGGGGGLG